MTVRCATRSLLLLLLTASPARAAVLTLAWDAQTDATGYVVYYGTATRSYSTQVDVGDKTGVVIRDLKPNTHYFFAVQAYNADRLLSPYSTEVDTQTDGSIETTALLDLVPNVAARDLDVAFEATTRRYLLTYSSGGRPYGLLLDVWGSLVTGPFVLADGAAGGIQPRVAAGNGRFLVAFTDTALGQRLARFVAAGATPTLSQAYVLGAATSSSSDADAPGGGLAYAGGDRFVATWENGGVVSVRGVSPSGPQASALDITTDLGQTGCTFSRAEIVWDPSQLRAVVAGSRDGSGCAGGTAVWMRIIDGTTSQLALLDRETVLTGSAAPHTYLRLAFDPGANRFLAAWSQRNTDGTTNVAYRVGDSTGGLSELRTIASGGAATASLEDDAYTDNAVTFDGTGGFTLISRAAQASSSVPGILLQQRIDGAAQVTGMLHDLPASGFRTYTAAVKNTLTGQVLVAYVDQAGHTRALALGPRTPTRVDSLSASATQVPAGSQVTVTAVAGGGIGPYEYRFWLYDAARAQWTTPPAFSTASAFQWTPPSTANGTFVVQVWTRSLGSAADFEAWRNITLTVVPPAPVAVSLASDRTFPVPAGTRVVWSAAASGGSGVLQHQFWLYDATAGSWSIAQPYSSATTFAWTPLRAGQYSLQVWTRSVGSTASYEAWAGSGPISITAPAAVAVTSLAATRTSTAPGTAITWTASASGGIAPLLYQFWRYNLGTATWTLAQPYSSATTYTWTPALNDVGSHVVQVWVRAAGSSASYDAWRASDVVAVANVSLRSLTTTTMLPAPVGTSIIWTASATAATGAVEYRFWIYSAATGRWQVFRDWGTAANATWVASAPGQYVVQVWARTVGSTRDWEAWLGTDYVTIR